jgi:flagellar protein FlbD
MIEVTKLNGDKMVVNADHLELVEAHPDTTLVLANERRIVVRDSVAQIVAKVVEYQRSIRTRTGLRVGGEGMD